MEQAVVVVKSGSQARMIGRPQRPQILELGYHIKSDKGMVATVTERSLNARGLTNPNHSSHWVTIYYPKAGRILILYVVS